MLSDQPHKAWEAEHLTMRVVSLHYTITMKENALTRSYYSFLLLVAHTRHQTERHASCTQFGHFACSMPVVGQVMACISVLEQPTGGIKKRIQAGDEHFGGNVWLEYLIYPF